MEGIVLAGGAGTRLYDNMKEMLRLKRENEELRKENLFLKKAAAFFA